MHVASLELCKELYELSNTYWNDTRFVYRETYSIYRSPETRTALVQRTKGTEPFVQDLDMESTEGYRFYYPAYDLGYLMRKLQEWEIMVMYTKIDRTWSANVDLGYPEVLDDRYPFLPICSGVSAGIEYEANTPEDAVAILCIELFKQGVLKREG